MGLFFRAIGAGVALLLPGGLVLVAGYFAGRAFTAAWRRHGDLRGSVRLWRTVESVRLKDVWGDVRGSRQGLSSSSTRAVQSSSVEV